MLSLLTTLGQIPSAAAAAVERVRARVCDTTSAITVSKQHLGVQAQCSCWVRMASLGGGFQKGMVPLLHLQHREPWQPGGHSGHSGAVGQPRALTLPGLYSSHTVFSISALHECKA